MFERLARAARSGWRDLGGPERAVLGGFAVAIAIGSTWGLPGSNTWAVDSISPRSCGLGAIVETYWPGHFHTYPPLHTALLTLLSLPWIALAALHVGLNRDALGDELIKPLYMTGIEASARAVTAAMALAIVWSTMRLWTRLAGRRAGVAAGVLAACDGTFVYYAHTGNLDVPYLFWTSFALVEMDRVLAGEPRERAALLLSVAAVLSKDQAAAALLLPLTVSLVVVPWASRGESPLRRRLVTGTLVATLLYGLVSGALVNPVGFRRRVAFLLGPASQTWAGYPRGSHGALAARCCDALRRRFRTSPRGRSPSPPRSAWSSRSSPPAAWIARERSCRFSRRSRSRGSSRSARGEARTAFSCRRRSSPCRMPPCSSRAQWQARPAGATMARGAFAARVRRSRARRRRVDRWHAPRRLAVRGRAIPRELAAEHARRDPGNDAVSSSPAAVARGRASRHRADC